MIIKNPFRRSQFLRVEERYDNQDLVIDNPSGESNRNHNFDDLKRVNQLTQNSWNHSPLTRETLYSKTTIKPERATKHDQYRNLLKLDEYHDPY